MSDTVKLLIEIPKKDYEWAKQIADPADKSIYYERQLIAISNGTPLDDVKAKIQASMYCDKDTRLVENANASGLKKALEIIDSFGKGE